MTTDPDDEISSSLVKDLTSEFHLRDEVPPYDRTKLLARRYIHAIETALARVREEDFEGWEVAQHRRQLGVSKLQPLEHNKRVAEPSLREIAKIMSINANRAWHLSRLSSPSIVPDEDNSDD